MANDISVLVHDWTDGGRLKDEIDALLREGYNVPVIRYIHEMDGLERFEQYPLIIAHPKADEAHLVVPYVAELCRVLQIDKPDIIYWGGHLGEKQGGFRLEFDSESGYYLIEGKPSVENFMKAVKILLKEKEMAGRD